MHYSSIYAYFLSIYIHHDGSQSHTCIRTNCYKDAGVRGAGAIGAGAKALLPRYSRRWLQALPPRLTTLSQQVRININTNRLVSTSWSKLSFLLPIVYYRCFLLSIAHHTSILSYSTRPTFQVSNYSSVYHHQVVIYIIAVFLLIIILSLFAMAGTFHVALLLVAFLWLIFMFYLTSY